MSLERTIDVARSSLAVVSDRSAVVSRNVAHAGDPGASRKVVRLTTDPGYAPRLAGIQRTTSDALQGRVIAATSDAAREEVVVAALEQLHAAADPQGSQSIAGRIGALRGALQTYSASPADASLAVVALNAAKDVVTALHESSGAVERVRAQADEDISTSVADLNKELARLGELDVKVVSGSRSGLDVTDDLDERDRVIGRIAEQVGLTVLRRSDNGISLYTDSGIALYDGVVRAVGLASSPLLPGQEGGALTIDGMRATGSGAVMRIGSGRLAGLFELRDGIAITFESQLDELARGLITALAETDQGQPPTLPPAAALLRASGSSAVPPAGIVQHGLAAAIEINPSVDPAQGGDVLRLRDGGIADPGNPAYLYNNQGIAGFTERVDQLVDALNGDMAAAPGTDLPTSARLPDMAAASIGWLQAQRQQRDEQSSYARALHERAQSAFETAAGVNIDEQLSELLELQRAYQASAKLITAVDAMFNSLLQAVG